MMKRVILILFTLLLLVSSSDAAPKAKKPAPVFGGYTERSLDLEVKVSGGTIKIWRIWEGGKRGWSINPQHEDLDISEETEADQYGHLFAKEIGRGLKKFGGSNLNSGGGGMIKQAKSQGNTDPDPMPPSLSSSIAGWKVDSCTSGDNRLDELMINTSSGNKWLTQSSREWAQYDQAGLLREFGVGANRIAKVLYADKVSTGYADTNDKEVITYHRDSEGRIDLITDYTGRQVEYKWENGDLAEVIDADGNSTKYEYSGAEIGTKTLGFGAQDTEEQKLHFRYGPAGQVSSIFDDNSIGSTFTYEIDKKKQIYIKTEKQSGNRIIRTETDSSGRVKKVDKNSKPWFRVYQLCEDSVIQDSHNRTTYFDRDGIGRLIKIVFPDGSWTTFEHTLANWPELDKPWGEGLVKPWGIKSMTFSTGRRIEYLRDDKGNIAEANESLETGKVRKWKFTYDAKGNKASQRLLLDPGNISDAKDWYDRWEYNEYGNVAKYIDAKGNTWKYEYNAQGYITKVTEPNQAEWKFEYTPMGRLKKRETPLHHIVQIDFNKRGLPKTQTDFYDDNKIALTLFKYNKRGLLEEVTDPLTKLWRFTYDESDDLRSAIDPENHTRQWEYDREGRVTGIIDGNLQKTVINYFDTALPGEPEQYDIPFPPRVQIIYPTFTEDQQYDLQGRLVALIRSGKLGASETTKFEYDLHDRLTHVVAPGNHEGTYTYDDLSRVVSSTTTGWGTTTTEYKDEDRKIIYHDTVGGTVEQNYNQLGQVVSEKRADGTIVNFDYDKVGNLTNVLNSNNQFARYEYDEAHRLTQLDTFPGPTATGTPAQTSTFRYNKRGNLLGFANQNVDTTNIIDSLGRTKEAITNYGSFQKSTKYTYLANGLRDTRTNPEGEVFTYKYDGADNLTSIVAPEGTISYEYSPENWVQPKSLIYPGGAKQEYKYDDLRRYSQITSKDPGGNTILDLTYAYKSDGQIESIQSQTGKAIYQYDEGGRVVSADGDDLSEHYTYDAIGRRFPGIYNAHGAVKEANGISYDYDPDGNRTKQDKRSYSYNESGRLVKAESSPDNTIATYGYDTLGSRVWKNVGGVKTYFHYDKDGMSGEYNAAGNLIRGYLFDGTTPLRMKTPSGTNYYHTDHLGTPRVLTSQSGGVTWSAKYSVFGKATIGINSQTNLLRFPGQYADTETGLYQNGMRDYDPNIGGYLEQDPYGIALGFNRYGYVDGNPISFIDPTGEIRVLRDLRDIFSRPGIQVVGWIALGVGLSAAPVATIVIFAASTLVGGGAYALCSEYFRDSCLHLTEEDCQDIGFSAGLATGIGLTWLRPSLIFGKAPEGVVIPDEALVVRGGVTTPEQVANGIGPHREVNGLTGFSAQSRAGASVDDLASTGGVGGGPFPHNQVSVTTAGDLRCVGCEVIPSPGGGANHVTVVPGPASPSEISGQFTQMPNPAKAR